MHTGMILNAFVSWFISFAALFASFSLFGKSRGKRIILAFALFWLTVGIVWFLAGLRLWFAWRGLFDIDRLIFFITQIFVLFHFLSVPYFAARQYFVNKKINLAIVALFTLIVGVAIFFLFKEGIEEKGITFFASKYSPNKITWTLFVTMFALIWISLLIRVGKELFFYLRKIPVSQPFLLANLSILLYGTIGFFDERGLIAGWALVFLRLILIISAILAYLSFQEKE